MSQQEPATSAQASSTRRSRRPVVVAALLAVVLAGGAVAGVLVFRGDEEKAAPAPTTFSINGTITVEAGDGSEAEIDGECITDGGYSDIRLGAQVTVKDEAGTVIAIGKVDSGRTTKAATLPTFNPETAQIEDQAQAQECSFGFSATGVPEGKQFYSVEVARRGEIRYQRDDVARSLNLTLGD
jgi:hypothetical protein